MKTTLLSLLLLSALFPWAVHSQTYYPRELLVNNDINGIFSSILEHHPNMFIFTPREVFDRRIAELKRSLPDSLTTYQAYSYIAPVVALVGEGHTFARLPMDLYYAHNPYWLTEHPYIDKKEMKLKLKKADFEYDEIVSINGHSNKEMVDKLLSYLGGETINGRIARINSIMPVVFALVDSSRIFRVEYVSEDGGLRTVELEGLRIKEHQQRIGARDENGNLKPESESDIKSKFNFSRVNPCTVLFSMPAFDEKYASPVIDSMFAYISSDRKIKNLIIDLRGNGGGDPSVCTQLLNYLSPVEFLDYSSDTVSWRETKEFIPGLTAPYPAKKRFDGNLYVLIDNFSYSASILFAHEIKRHHIGTLIGGETGGSIFTHGFLATIDASCKVSVEVPYVVFKVPDFDRYKRTLEPVTPDVEVPSDKALEKVLEVIASRGSKRGDKKK